jgi:hypothetical protein
MKTQTLLSLSVMSSVKIALVVELRMPDQHRKIEWTLESGALITKNASSEELVFFDEAW